MTYKFPQFELEIVDPTIEIMGLAQGNPKTFDHDYINNRYGVHVYLWNNGVRFHHALENVQAESMNMNENGQLMPQQVLTALNEQFAI